MEDYIILRAGYNNAVNEILKELKDMPNYDILESRIERLKIKYNEGYKGVLAKLYDKENQLGYTILNDTEGIKGVCIFIADKKYKELDEEELVFVIKNVEQIWKETFTDKTLINKKYEEFLEPYSSM